jgi:hypothetical protein
LSAFSFLAMGIESSALIILGKHSTTEPHLQPCWVCFFFFPFLRNLFLLLYTFYFHIINVLGYIWHLQKCLQYISIKFTPSIILLYLLSPILRVVSTGLIFPFSCMST